jgi:hypothetical protein
MFIWTPEDDAQYGVVELALGDIESRQLDEAESWELWLLTEARDEYRLEIARRDGSWVLVGDPIGPDSTKGLEIGRRLVDARNALDG